MVFTAFSTAGILLVKAISPKTSFNSITIYQTILPSLKESISNHDGIRKDLHYRIKKFHLTFHLMTSSPME